MSSARQRAWIPWAIVGFLFFLCAFLAVLQNRWLDEVSRADTQRLHEELQDELDLTRREFDGEVQNAVASLIPPVEEILEMGADKAVARRFARHNDANSYFLSAKVTVGGSETHVFDPEADRTHPGLIDLPIPGSPDRLQLELDLGYLRHIAFPLLLARYLGTQVKYEAEIVSGMDRNMIIFQTNPGLDLTSRRPDGVVSLLDFHSMEMPHQVGGPPPGPPPGRWRLLVRYQEGSLDAIVARARWENASISAGLLALILATGAILVRSSRRAHRLAELQFNFVTGISHELRTPITVIRTAAFNLRGKLATQPSQVERYGKLIQAEGEKLSTLVEQVLAFASARSGRATQPREPLAVDALIEQVIASSNALHDAGVAVEKRVEPALPIILADPVAIRNALNNLLDNALKYGVGRERWVGISASSINGNNGQDVEIRVADHGVGIPKEEQSQIFEPFFRCRSAISDQVHGTGLGLSLVQSIVEAHGGGVSVESDPGRGTTIVMRLPAAPTKYQNEFANSLS